MDQSHQGIQQNYLNDTNLYSSPCCESVLVSIPVAMTKTADLNNLNLLWITVSEISVHHGSEMMKQFTLRHWKPPHGGQETQRE